MAATGCAARIDLDALTVNFAEVTRRAPGREPIAVIKAEAYGHGAVAVARRLAELGCRHMAVVSLEEADELGRAGIEARFLLLGGVTTTEDARRAVKLGVTPVIHDAHALSVLGSEAARVGKRTSIHIEVDTGMSRMGVHHSEAVSLMAAVGDHAGLTLEGVFTHFASAEDPDPSSALEQIGCFSRVLRQAEEDGIRPRLVHTDNSAALLSGKIPATALPAATAVRPGLMLYGVSPAPHLDPEARLRPVMRVSAPVVALRDVAAGTPVGYGATFLADRDTRLATVRMGYADGYLIAASNRGFVSFAGARCPVVGRVSMDYITVDVGRLPVEIGDHALIFGDSGDGGIRVEEAAAWAGTIPYELLVRVGHRVPRLDVTCRG